MPEAEACQYQGVALGDGERWQQQYPYGKEGRSWELLPAKAIARAALRCRGHGREAGWPFTCLLAWLPLHPSLIPAPDAPSPNCGACNCSAVVAASPLIGKVRRMS